VQLNVEVNATKAMARKRERCLIFFSKVRFTQYIPFGRVLGSFFDVFGLEQGVFARDAYRSCDTSARVAKSLAALKTKKLTAIRR
jgi:hypothetical protein